MPIKIALCVLNIDSIFQTLKIIDIIYLGSKILESFACHFLSLSSSWFDESLIWSKWKIKDDYFLRFTHPAFEKNSLLAIAKWTTRTKKSLFKKRTIKHRHDWKTKKACVFFNLAKKISKLDSRKCSFPRRFLYFIDCKQIKICLNVLFTLE